MGFSVSLSSCWMLLGYRSLIEIELHSPIAPENARSKSSLYANPTQRLPCALRSFCFCLRACRSVKMMLFFAFFGLTTRCLDTLLGFLLVADFLLTLLLVGCASMSMSPSQFVNTSIHFAYKGYPPSSTASAEAAS